MLNFGRAVLLVSLIFGSALPGFTQTTPCQAGTLANVLGTSCSVGNIVFNFQSAFVGGANASNQPITILPAAIGFLPIQNGNQIGFKLLTNFTDGPGAGPDNTFNEAHLVQFSYTPQAVAGFEIRGQGLSADAAAQGAASNIAFVQVLDFQDYPNTGFLATAVAINIENNVTLFDQLSNNQILEVPGFLSTGSGIAGAATTQIFDFATGLAFSSLSSVTFLYTEGPNVPSPAPADLTYSGIDLPGQAATFVSNITNSGRIVGSYQDLSGVIHAYIAERDGSFTTIDVPGAIVTFGVGLNERGDLAGSFTDSAGVSHGFLQRDGNITTFDFPGATFTGPSAINDRDQIVGQYISADGGFHGFLLDDGVFTTIDHGPFPGFTGAFAVNDRTEIAGSFFDPDTTRGFIQFHDSFHPIDVPGQGQTVILGINGQDDFVGIYSDLNLVQHGFLSMGGAFRTADFPGGSNTVALGINGSGQVVGEYSDSAGNTHSFLAQPANIDQADQNQPSPSVATSTVQVQSKPDCGTEKSRRLKIKPPDSTCH